MGSFLSVAKGSDEPPVFLEIHYRGSPSAGEPPLVFVGKGITFDRYLFMHLCFVCTCVVYVVCFKNTVFGQILLVNLNVLLCVRDSIRHFTHVTPGPSSGS